MIKKLHLYIIKEIYTSFLFGVLVFSLLLILNIAFELVELALSKGVAVLLVLILFLFYLPNILTLSIPMAVLFGVLLSYGKLSSDNEITAMKSSGLGYKTLTIPVISLVLTLSIFLVFFNHFIAPVINNHSKHFYEEIITKSPLAKFNAKSIVNIGNYSLYANKVNNKNNTLFGISIYKFENNEDSENQKNQKNILPQNDKETWRISAAYALVKAYDNGVQLILHNGYIQKANPSNLSEITHMTFNKYIFFIALGQKTKENTITLASIQSPKLLEIISEYKKQGMPFSEYVNYQRDFWLRWVFSIAPIAFIIIALPLGLNTNKRGKAMSFGVSLGIIILYYMLFIVATSLGEKEYVPLSIIMWLPNFVTILAGSCLFLKMVKK
ncbi:MAG: LptF/LptG family permease [Elusimicrobiota bacterium]|jgi:lipopolysaccharide export system permease protein|nr:LptF/LptG family permease [Elusimicrobiota bacterium]